MKVCKNKIYDATQWNKLGDHPNVKQLTSDTYGFRNGRCSICRKSTQKHGVLCLEDGSTHILCHGDWIVERAGRFKNVYLDEIFNKIFNKVEKQCT